MENRPPTWTILNHLPPGPREGPGENNIIRRERVYLFQGSPRNQPKLLHLFSDGNFVLLQNAHPLEPDILELIGHSRGLLCFKNKSQRQLVVWDIDAQTVRRDFDDVDEMGESSYGFGHVRGHFMGVRLGRQPLFSNGQTYGYHLHTFIETEREVWNRIKFHSNSVYDFTTSGSAIYVPQNGMMYWKAEVNEVPSIITYQLATEQVGSLVCPVEAILNNIEMAAMVLGHGFKGQLSAAVYVPPATNGENSFLNTFGCCLRNLICTVGTSLWLCVCLITLVMMKYLYLRSFTMEYYLCTLRVKDSTKRFVKCDTNPNPLMYPLIALARETIGCFLSCSTKK